MLNVTVNEPVPLRMLATDGRTDLYGQLRVYDAVGALYVTLDLDHIAEGLYGNTWTPIIEGYYTAVAQLYFDIGRTVDAGYEKNSDEIDVNSIKTNILRILGIVHENAVIDQQVYDGQNNLTSARVRCYDSKVNAQAAGLTGLRFTYGVTAVYSGNLLTKYEMVRDL